MNTTALIVAAGRGTRAAGGPTDGPGHERQLAAHRLPKQYAALGTGTVLGAAVAACLDHPDISRVQVVIHADDRNAYEAAIAAVADRGRLAPPVTGGATRQASVLSGLEALAPQAPARVLIHDAARPFLPRATIDRLIAALAHAPGALAARPVTDTLKRAGEHGRVAATVERAGLWAAQTPQAFAFEPILAAHRRAAGEAGREFTDDAAVAEWAGLEVALVEGAAETFKITTSEDLARANEEWRRRMQADPITFEPRTGTGFDVHRFAPGSSVWLCGVEIAHSARLEGHSDADVALHALTDALLGAIGDGDIGQHFPPSDPQWKGAASHLFLRDAAQRVAARGGRISNVDVTLLCEAPKVSPHRERMRATVAEILGIGIDRVGVKATTTEGLGFTGRREGIAAMASATVLLPCSGNTG